MVRVSRCNATAAAPLRPECVDQKSHSCDIAAGAVETGNETELPDRVGANHENDRNGSGCSFGCHRRLRGQRNNHGHRVGHQLSGQFRQPVEATIGRAIFDRNVATFDIASLLQALSNGAEHSIIELSAGKQADQRQAWLLRARRERPRGHAAEEYDELASPHGSPSSGPGPQITNLCRRA